MYSLKLILFPFIFFQSCTGSNDSNKSEDPITKKGTNQQDERVKPEEQESTTESPNDYHTLPRMPSSGNDCGFHDGTYSAEVSYSNPATGFSNEYTLDVEIEGCQVVQIDFDNGGYLNGDHIDPANLDEDGSPSVDDDRGRTFDIQLDVSDKDERADSDDPENDEEPDK